MGKKWTGKISVKDSIERAKALSLKNYNKGYDFFVECYDKAEWETFMGQFKSWTEAADMMSIMADDWQEKQSYGDF